MTETVVQHSHSYRVPVISVDTLSHRCKPRLRYHWIFELHYYTRTHSYLWAAKVYAAWNHPHYMRRRLNHCNRLDNMKGLLGYHWRRRSSYDTDKRCD